MSSHETELVDLVDNAGTIQRTGVPRSEAEQINGPKLHIPIIGCVVMNALGEVLVHERAAGKRFGGCLDHVFGAIDSGETPEQAALRECDEELGVRPRQLILVKRGVSANNYYEYLFTALCNNAPKIENEREIAWASYMKVSDLRAAAVDGSHQFTTNFFPCLDAAISAADGSFFQSNNTNRHLVN